jgi:hypothetical protein
MPNERVGLMIIRAWSEAGSSKPLRAHLRLTSDLGTGFESDEIFADIDPVCDLVRLWLERVLTNGAVT